MVSNLISFRKLPYSTRAFFHSSNYCIFLLCLLTFNFISFSHLSLPFARCVCHPCRHPHQLQCARQGPGCAQYDAYIQKYDHWCGDADASAGKPHNGRHLLHCRCGCHPRGRWSLQQAGGAAHRCAYPITGHRLHAVSTRKGGQVGARSEGSLDSDVDVDVDGLLCHCRAHLTAATGTKRHNRRCCNRRRMRRSSDNVQPHSHQSINGKRQWAPPSWGWEYGWGWGHRQPLN